MRFFGQSVRQRLLLVIIGTVLVIVGVHDVLAVRAVHRMALTVATTRLQSVSDQITDMLVTQARQMRRQAAAAGQHPAVRAFLDDPASATRRDSAAAVLTRDLGNTLVGISVRNDAGVSLLDTGKVPAVDSTVVKALVAAAGSGDSATIGRLAQVRDSLVYGTVARVGNGTQRHGYVIEWRRFTRSREGQRQLLDLIGSNASLYVGNTDGEGWTNFADLVARPPMPRAEAGEKAGEPRTYERPGSGRRLASVRPVVGTPWTLLIEFPEVEVFEPVRSMIGDLAVTLAPLLLLGVAAAWWLSARLTTPLRGLAGAAAAMSAGDYNRRVHVRGSDEVATLAGAFNRMADSVSSAHQVLAERADELAHRAEQLEEQATELEITNEELVQSIDELTRTRDELGAVTAELDACLAGAPVGFALHDGTGCYRRVNASLAKLHGVEIDAHVGRLPSEIHPELGGQLERHVVAVLANGVPAINVELSSDANGRGGVTQHWLVSVFPIRSIKDESLGVASVVTDLTAYKQLERQLLQSQKMEAVGRLAGGVAHDFNNILTAISGFGQFVLADLDPATQSGARSDVEQVLAAAERGGALTRQLLAFSRQQVLQPRVLNLNAVVTSLGPMLARLIGTDVRLRTVSSPDLGMVKADPNQMEQVLVNLVVNARDAMPHGGSITVETADVELDASYALMHEGVRPGQYVMLAVTDSGIGMDPTTRARVFDPFFTTKGPGEGTGLGLSTVYGIVKQSGGNIEVYSELGQGTSFKVYLPRTAEQPGESLVGRGGLAAPNGRATVLLVDDDAMVSAAARRALERGGYAVLSASNGPDGLRIAGEQNGNLDLLITDMVMPGMGGRELARRVMRARPSIRVLYTSGYTAQAMNQQAILQPGDAFLGKPFTPDALLRRVDEVLHARVAQRA